MTALQTFNFSLDGKSIYSSVRVVMIDGEPWWVVADVCRIIGISNPTVAAERLDDDEKAKFDLGFGSPATIANESGLYNLIIRSDKPEAKAFRKWVTSEVLPQIRKTGSYSVKELSRKDLALMIIQAEEELEKVKSVLIEQKPKVDAWQNFLDCDGLIDLGYVAQVCKTGKNRLFENMRENKIFFYKGMYNAPYQSYVDQGLFDVKFKPHPKLGPIPVIRCTTKGAEWIFNKFYRKAA